MRRNKAAEEHKVVTQFCLAVGEKYNITDIQNREPPEPDILCTINGERSCIKDGQRNDYFSSDWLFIPIFQ